MKSVEELLDFQIEKLSYWKLSEMKKSEFFATLSFGFLFILKYAVSFWYKKSWLDIAAIVVFIGVFIYLYRKINKLFVEVNNIKYELNIIDNKVKGHHIDKVRRLMMKEFLGKSSNNQAYLKGIIPLVKLETESSKKEILINNLPFVALVITVFSVFMPLYIANFKHEDIVPIEQLNKLLFVFLFIVVSIIVFTHIIKTSIEEYLNKRYFNLKRLYILLLMIETELNMENNSKSPTDSESQ